MSCGSVNTGNENNGKVVETLVRGKVEAIFQCCNQKWADLKNMEEKRSRFSQIAQKSIEKCQGYTKLKPVSCGKRPVFEKARQDVTGDSGYKW